MRIRHLVTRANVDFAVGTVIDPLQIRHGVIVGAKVAALAGPVDPRTHLNLDFPDHRATDCLIVEGFELGAAVAAGPERFLFAAVDSADYAHRGRVDVGAQRQAWLAAFATQNMEG